jgi:hypothetical protein
MQAPHHRVDDGPRHRGDRPVLPSMTGEFLLQALPLAAKCAETRLI